MQLRVRLIIRFRIRVRIRGITSPTGGSPSISLCSTWYFLLNVSTVDAEMASGLGPVLSLRGLSVRAI